MKKLLFISAIFWAIIFLIPEIKAQTPPDSCLKMMWPDSTWKVFDDINKKYDYYGSINRDSIRIDSCIGSPTFGKQYAKRYFAAGFNRYPFANAIPKDSVYRSSMIIDSHTKLQIQNLETKYGVFYFVRNYRDSDDPDSLYFNAGYVEIRLNNYVCADSLLYYLKNTVDSINGAQLDFIAQNYNDHIYAGVEESIFQHSKLFPNPVDDFLILKIEEKLEKIEIFSIEGIKLKEMEYQNKIDVSFLNTGIYFLKVNNKFYKFVKK